MRYATSAAFRQALDDRLKTEAANTGLGTARLRKRVAFELFLRRLVAVAPGRWILKGALALLETNQPRELTSQFRATAVHTTDHAHILDGTAPAIERDGSTLGPL